MLTAVRQQASFDAATYRAAQVGARTAVLALDEPPFRVTVPERVNEPIDLCRTASPTSNVWTEDYAAPSRLPASFLRFSTDHLVGPDYDLDGVTCHELGTTFIVHDEGLMVVSVACEFVFDGPIDAERARQVVEQHGNDALLTESRRQAQCIIQLLVRAGVVPDSERAASEPEILGFHRLYDVVAPTTSADDFEQLLVLAGSEGLTNVCPSSSTYCYVGNGNSLIVRPDRSDDSDTSPRAMLEHYEYVYAGLLMFDGDVFELIRSAGVMSRRTDIEHDEVTATLRRIEELRDAVDIFLFRLAYSLNSLRPTDLAYWEQLVGLWRVAEIERDLRRKVSVLDDLATRLSGDLTRRLSARTNQIVVLLTCLTLTSIVIDVSSYLGEDQASPFRVSLTAVGLMAAGVLFFVTRRPR